MKNQNSITEKPSSSLRELILKAVTRQQQDATAFQSDPPPDAIDNYLSVDLDFWADSKVNVEFLQRVIASVPKRHMVAAVYHQHILPHLRRYAKRCRRIVNLDAHSDISGVMNVAFEDGETDDRRLELHEGSWGDYVPFDSRTEFVWAYPDRKWLKEGRCDHFGSDCAFTKIKQHPNHQWKKLSCYQASGPDYGIDLRTVRAAAIVLSPDYCGRGAFGAFRDLVQNHGLELIDCLPECLEEVRPW